MEEQTPSQTPHRIPRFLRPAVDAGLALTYLVQMLPGPVGNPVHELCGLAFVALFVAHHVLNRGWLSRLGRQHSLRARVTLASDVVLTACVLLTALAGVAMSRSVLPLLAQPQLAHVARPLHGASAHLGLMAVSLHVGLHLRVIGAYAGLRVTREPRRALAWVLLAVAVALGLIAALHLDVPAKLTGQPGFPDAMTPWPQQLAWHLALVAPFLAIGALLSTQGAKPRERSPQR